jgi:hypothetical protein
LARYTVAELVPSSVHEKYGPTRAKSNTGNLSKSYCNIGVQKLNQLYLHVSQRVFHLLWRWVRPGFKTTIGKRHETGIFKDYHALVTL